MDQLIASLAGCSNKLNSKVHEQNENCKNVLSYAWHKTKVWRAIKYEVSAIS